MQSDQGLGLEEKRQCSSAQRLVAGSCYTTVRHRSTTALYLPVLAYTVLYCATVTNCPLFLSWGLHLKPYTRHMQPTASPGHLTSCLVNHDTAPVCSVYSVQLTQGGSSGAMGAIGGDITDHCHCVQSEDRYKYQAYQQTIDGSTDLEFGQIFNDHIYFVQIF